LAAMLGQKLFSELEPRFFAVLTSPNARLYVDVADALETEMPSRADALEHAEVIAVIERLLAQNRPWQPEENAEPEESASPSSLIYRRLVQTGWLEEERHSDYRRTVYVDPAAQALLEAFRTIVSQNIASFTGKLRLVCDRLADLRLPHARADLPWEELRACLEQVRSGLRELRLIRKQVERYAHRQMRAATLAEALDLIYNEFSQLITQRCYRELIHARLPERLREAMAGLTELAQDELALRQLREDFLRTQTGLDAGQAAAEIMRTIQQLELALGDVEPLADRVDTSTAEFARRSRARIRYIQDVGSARRQQVKTIFDYVREHCPATRLVDLQDHLSLPDPRLAEIGLLGTASIRGGRRLGPKAERRPVLTALTDDDKEESLREMERNLRNALRLDRANKFVDRLQLAAGQTVRSGDLPVISEDCILDVISCLVFAPAGGANYRLKTMRQEHPGEPVLYDAKAGFDLERFELEKK
jgi:chorismate mutase